MPNPGKYQYRRRRKRNRKYTVDLSSFSSFSPGQSCGNFCDPPLTGLAKQSPVNPEISWPVIYPLNLVNSQSKETVNTEQELLSFKLIQQEQGICDHSSTYSAGTDPAGTSNLCTELQLLSRNWSCMNKEPVYRAATT